ncbi:MAG: hemolysin family protein [Acidobacteriaceae bacterium]|nr:hemolysin family protein [Acidobacteriaceae bacterium]
MNAGYHLTLAVLLAILALAAYVDRVYGEMGKFLAREYQDNIDAWTRAVEPRLHLSRESLALSASVLRQLSLAAIAMLLGLRLYLSADFGTTSLGNEVTVTLFELILLILLFDRLIPQLLFARTKGLWIARIRYLLEVLFYLILPVTLTLGLLLSIVALAEPEDAEEEEHPSEAMDALLEAGEEEGILEESDRELVRSAVEFGDKVVREVMTPRPAIFAVPETLSLTGLLEELKENSFSRVPVFAGSLDHVTGIVFARDLLQELDADADKRTVGQLQKPTAFVPETKKVAELLREMQHEKQHMKIVIDEYGGVAGLVTIEDLLEAIVGSIADEHDEAEEVDEPVREAEGRYVVPGSFELSRLRELFSEPEPSESASATSSDEAAQEEDHEPSHEARSPIYIPQHYEATTLGGLVSEIAGHIPLPGEVVEEDGLRLEVLASTDRKVERVRVSLVEPAEE